MICPHCKKAIHFEDAESTAYEHENPEAGAPTGYEVAHGFCPACSELIVLMRDGTYWSNTTNGSWLTDATKETILYPDSSLDGELPEEVPEPYRTDFQEATAVLGVSPKASAAISRRLLQSILRDKFRISSKSLADEIEAFVNLPGVPTFLAEAVDAVRAVGNIAAHPAKSRSTGEIVDVEPGEAEWLIKVLETLCDFSFVQPRRLEQRRGELNAKLAELGRPPLKGPASATGRS